MAEFTKVEDDTQITYTGIGSMSGAEYKVTKDSNALILSIKIPHSISPQTWEDIKEQLDLKI